MTAEREAAIRARLAAATPGPWEWHQEDQEMIGHDPDPLFPSWPFGHVITDCNGRASVNERDADLIANAPADLAYLLALSNRQATALDEVQALADRWDDGHTGTQRLYCPTCCEVDTLRAAVGLAGDVGAGRRGQAADQSQGPLRAAGGDQGGLGGRS